VLADQVGFLLRLAMQRHTAIFMASMVEELTQQQFASLAKLHEVGRCSQNHLGRLIALDAATIKGVVDRLRARGFVRITTESSDKRRLYIELTERGLDTVLRAEAAGAKITADTLEPLTPAERRSVIRLLRKLT
jgi:DNA-binding MarR family transcriptional regulator